MRGSGTWQAALIFAAVNLLYFWPALTGQGVLSQTGALYDWVPWSAFRPPDLHEYDSRIADHTLESYPWLDYARGSIRSGDLPEWNPHALGGTPFLANQLTALFSPFSVPFWVLPFDYSFALVSALKLWVAAFGTYLLVRELRLGFWPATVAGLAFGFCPFSIVWLLHQQVNVVVLLPWMVWAVERLARRGSAGDGLLLAVFTAFALLGGHPGTQVHVVAAVVLFAVIRLLLARELTLKSQFGRIGVVTAALGVGALIAGVALLPAAHLVPQAAGPFDEAHSGGGATLPWSTVRTLFFPDWWGRPSAVQVSPGPDGLNFNVRTFYVGVAPLALAIVALTVRADWRTKLPFAVLVFLGFAIPLGIEPFHWIAAHLPLLESLRNARLLFVVDFGVAVLAAYGLAYLLGRIERGGMPQTIARRSLVVAGGAIVLGLVTALALTPDPRALAQTANHFLTGADYAIARVLQLTAIGWWTLFALGFLVALLLARRFGPLVLAPAVAALVVADLGHFQYGYQPTVPAEHVYGFTPPSLAFLQRKARTERIVALSGALPADTFMAYRLSDVRGYEPPPPSERFLRFFLVQKRERLVYRGVLNSGRIIVTDLRPNVRRLLDVMSVHYVLTAPGDTPSAPRLTRVYSGQDANVFRNEQSAPRAYVPTRVVVTEDEKEGFTRVTGRPFVPGEDATVEAAVDVRAGMGTARVVEEHDTRVEVRASLSQAGLVVLTDTWADGWTVTVDDRPAEELRVNTLSRGVQVPAGAHTIVWRYRTPGLVAGLALTLLGLALTLAWLGWVVLAPKHRREPAPVTSLR